MKAALCSVHTHSTLCDGKNTLAEVARAAFLAGVRHFGASGHSATPVPADEGCTLPEDISAYLAELKRLRAEYEGRMEILRGIEWDFCSRSGVPEGLDYFIGSVHTLFDGRSGKYYTIDWKMDDLLACRDEMFGGDFTALAAGYYESLASVAAKKPDILGHFDLITKLNGDGSLFDENSAKYRAAALSVLDAADPATTLIEINTGVVYRGYRKRPYPALFILEEWRARGGNVIITSDVHSADGVVFGYDAAEALAREAGYRESVLLTLSGWKSCEL